MVAVSKTSRASTICVAMVRFQIIAYRSGLASVEAQLLGRVHFGAGRPDRFVGFLCVAALGDVRAFGRFEISVAVAVPHGTAHGA